MDSGTTANRAGGYRIPSEVAGLDDGRTSYLPADVLRGLNLQEVVSMGAFVAGSPKREQPKPGSPKPGKPKPGSPKPGKPRSPGSPKA